MSLRVWLPLNGDLRNQGLDQITVTSSNISTTDGKIGKSYQFNDSNSYINLGDISKYFNGNPFSISFWIYSEESGTRGVIFSGYGLSSTSNFFSLEINGSSGTMDNYLRFDWKGVDTLFHSVITPNIWLHIVITYDGTKISCYRNGELFDSVTKTLVAIPIGNSYYLGRDSRTGNTTLNGKLNDFRIYDYALSEQEIKKLAQGLILHYPLNNKGFGQENLILDSKAEKTGASNVAQWFRYNIVLPSSSYLTNNYDYTISFDAKMSNGTDVFYIGWANNDSTQEVMQQGIQVTSIYKRYYFTGQTTKTNINSFVISNYKGYGRGNNNNTSGVLSIKNFKLEYGVNPTVWIPHKNDNLYSFLQIGNNKQVDISGNLYNGIKNNITYSTDSPLYKCSSVLNGSNSYIKNDNNNWISNYPEQLTVSIWAYSNNWSGVTNGGRIWSCTETGGFNIQGGASGYWRFSVYCATNSEHTSHAYYYNNSALKISDLSEGWHMITWVYTTTEHKVYLDGQLINTYKVQTYGIKFNTGARLFLGCEASGPNPSAPYFNGKLSDFRIYATALSADDIKELYENREKRG